LFSAKELVEQLNKLLFDIAAQQFFSNLDVEALVAEQASLAYTFEDRDELHDHWELEHEWPYRNWISHEPKRSCHCWWCIEYWMPDDEEMYRPHDFDRRCPCPVCQTFQYQEMIRDMERREQEWRACDKDPREVGLRKRKRQEAKGQNAQSHASWNEEEARQQLRHEIRNVKTTERVEEDQLPLANDDLAWEEFEVRKQKKRCLGLFRLVKQVLRQLPSP
jgi:hypothetical protein